MKLYSFFRSGTSHRLRIALRLKGLPVDYVAVDLRTEQLLDSADKTLNPQGLVPALVLPDARVLTQTPAIIEWLEERHPTPSPLPTGSIARARVRALAGLVGCDIHPLNNRRVLEYLRHHVHHDELAINAWCGTWIGAGFDAFETLLAADTHRSAFCLGAAPTLADVYLIPQVESARRFKLDLARWPRIEAVDAACAGLDAFCLAAPAMQPDAA